MYCTYPICIRVPVHRACVLTSFNKLSARLIQGMANTATRSGVCCGVCALSSWLSAALSNRTQQSHTKDLVHCPGLRVWSVGCRGLGVGFKPLVSGQETTQTWPLVHRLSQTPSPETRTPTPKPYP